MPKPGRVKKIVDPVDGMVIARVPVVDALVTVEGSGIKYRRALRTFANDESADIPRTTHVKHVIHTADPDTPGDTDDPSQSVDVEEIDRFVTIEGSGLNFRRVFHTVNWDSRKTHRSKLRHKAEPDVPGDADDDNTWIEVERADSLTMFEGSGLSYQKTIMTLDWNDDEFNAAAYATDAKVDSDPDGEFDPPWRLDPFQRIVNISRRRRSITLSWTFAITNNFFVLPGEGTVGPRDFDVPGGSVIVGEYATSNDVELFGPVPASPAGVVVTGLPSASPTSFSFADWTESGIFLTPRPMIEALSATFAIRGGLIISQGLGYYGDPAFGPLGTYGGGIAGGIYTRGETLSVDASGAAITVFGVPYVNTLTQISSSVGGVTVLITFSPP